ncbi:DUF4861 domain-containing protein [Algoriphagus aestuariicola]|uniref:DUF4861 domain-containing protein n=1 Tax=Algoriphagus aestuariicola TaxID=1852016 RepID=A0ABS3BUT5_9BACT|nr:DUF4861 domain-containing protein [Algoriphagus aestuariicola]MBN7803049.1 DUF4861 domain-containing protein [Algoriphagus aestuariicola]
MNPRYQRIVSRALCAGVYSLVVLQAEGAFSQQAVKEVSLVLTNPTDLPREHGMVTLSSDILPGISKDSVFVVYQDDLELPSQWISEPSFQGLGFVVPIINSAQSVDIRLRAFAKDAKKNYPKRTQAELSHKVGGHFENREYIGGHFVNVDSLHVPKEHTDHSWFIRYEGPGWESDLVGYRFYLDWRNGIDVFGKKVKRPVLQDVGQDGFDSYHEPAEWGMDVLKVGKTLGLGSIAVWENGQARRVDETDSLYAEITENGPVYSSVLTNYYGWNLQGGKTDIRSQISIHAGTRLSKIQLTSSAPIQNFATGLIKDPKAELFKSNSDLPFGYIATYGKQSLADDNLGIAVIFPKAELLELTEDTLSHVAVFTGEKKTLTYYILAAWEQEPGGIRSKEEFEKYLNQQLLELSYPLEVKR